MKLYHIQFDDQPYFVEAESLGQAVAAWRAHVAVLWGSDYDGDEEPESIALVHDEPVVRARDGQVVPMQPASSEGTAPSVKQYAQAAGRTSITPEDVAAALKAGADETAVRLEVLEAIADRYVEDGVACAFVAWRGRAS